MRILVVDDSNAVRARLVELLSEEPGVQSIEDTPDADQAIALLRGSPFDVVVLDIHLAEKNGLAVLDALGALGAHQAEHSLQSTCVIVLTNDASDHYRRAALSRGARFFLDKSTEFERVADIVNEQLSRRRA